MPDALLAEIAGATAEHLVAEFNLIASMRHVGQRGSAREEPVLEWVASRLPGTVVAHGSGEVIDVSGSASSQQDIIITDRNTPAFVDKRQHRVHPIESVHGVIEVKSRLNRAETLKACETIRSVKRLAKSSYYPDVLGRTPEPTLGYIFAYESSTRIETIARNVWGWCEVHPPEEWPDAVYVLNRGVVAWADDKLQERVVRDGNLLAVEFTPGKTLLTTAFHLHMAFVAAWTPRFNMHPYLGPHTGQIRAVFPEESKGAGN